MAGSRDPVPDDFKLPSEDDDAESPLVLPIQRRGADKPQPAVDANAKEDSARQQIQPLSPKIPADVESKPARTGGGQALNMRPEAPSIGHGESEQKQRHLHESSSRSNILWKALFLFWLLGLTAIVAYQLIYPTPGQPGRDGLQGIEGKEGPIGPTGPDGKTYVYARNGSYSVGDIFLISEEEAIPPGFLPADGEQLKRSDYQEYFDRLKISKWRDSSELPGLKSPEGGKYIVKVKP